MCDNISSYTDTFMITNEFVEHIRIKLEQHHKLYRFPVKAELWEDIFDQVLNGNESTWEGGGHSTGADVVCKSSNTKFQLKSGDLSFGKNTVKWNGHRTTQYKTISEKVAFISIHKVDKYVMLARSSKDWKNGIKRYYLLVFDSSVIQYDKLVWSETIGKNGLVNGWVGKSEPDLGYSALISKAMSDQLWTTASLTCLGTPFEILL